jgi:hypothetical protein
MSGLCLRNGGGRPEVNAAHFIPVERQGSDAVHDGLALSGTPHWMFDRGLVSVADDWSILVSRNKVPGDVIYRLIVPDGRLVLPPERRDRPKRNSLRWHRENVFGHMRAEGPRPWDWGRSKLVGDFVPPCWSLRREDEVARGAGDAGLGPSGGSGRGLPGRMRAGGMEVFSLCWPALPAAPSLSGKGRTCSGSPRRMTWERTTFR